MLTSALGGWRAGLWFVLLTCALLVSVTGCETVQVVEPAPTQPEDTEPEEPDVTPVEVAPVTGAMIVRMQPGSHAEMPDGATATVTLDGASGSYSAEMPKDERMVRFDALQSGRYDLLVTVDSRGVRIGSFSYFVDVTDAVGDVTVQIDYLRADLVVDVSIETSLERRYAGISSIRSDACQVGGPSGTTRSDLRLAMDGDRLELMIDNFQQRTLQLSGRIAPGAAPFSAAGTFQATDGMAGDWNLTHLTAPMPGAIAAVIELNDGTRSCQSTLDYAGLLEGSAGGAGTGGLISNAASAAVEVVGHGRTHTVTVDRGESAARFDGLLVGPYDISVGVRHGTRVVEGRRESVVLTGEGARVRMALETEWAPAAASPLASMDYEALGHTFEGKSMVTSGPAECTGSIPLVDTTRLDISGNPSALEMTFDSFYGKVLELTGVPGDAQGMFTASGTYRSSDAKTGSWTINRIVAPTSRSVGMVVEFNNETDMCRATLEFVGLR